MTVSDLYAKNRVFIYKLISLSALELMKKAVKMAVGIGWIKLMNPIAVNRCSGTAPGRRSRITPVYRNDILLGKKFWEPSRLGMWECILFLLQLQTLRIEENNGVLQTFRIEENNGVSELTRLQLQTLLLLLVLANHPMSSNDAVSELTRLRSQSPPA
nr:hypothetical protein Iba_chr13aCG8980 [Ipomoea batatas]